MRKHRNNCVVQLRKLNSISRITRFWWLVSVIFFFFCDSILNQDKRTRCSPVDVKVTCELEREYFHKMHFTLTGNLLISSKRALGEKPFLPLHNTYMRFTSGQQRNNFSISTFPIKPVPPVTNSVRPANHSTRLSFDIVSSVRKKKMHNLHKNR